MRTLRRWLAVPAIGVLLATGCGGDDAAESTTPDVTEASDPVDEPAAGADGECTAEGGDLTIGVRNEPVGFDPYVAGSSGSQGGGERIAVFDILMQYDQETGEYEPRMAESLEPNDDATEWTLTLREGVTFANGEPVDTAAVKFSVNRHRAEDSTSLSRPQASMVESMDIVDDRTMVFHLTAPWGNFPALLGGPVGILVHPGTFQKLGAEAFAADPQDGGAGPFRLARWAPGEELVLEARDDYWRGPVCLDTVTFRYGQDTAARYEAFKLGDLDVAFLGIPDIVAQADDDGYEMFTEITNAGLIVQVNHGAHGAEQPGSDVRVRRAIAHAIDEEVVDQRGFDGQGTSGRTLVPESSILNSPELEGIPHDPDRARELLAEAMADGYDGSLHFLCNDVFQDAAIAIAGMLEDVGFTVDLEANMAIGDWVPRLMKGDYDIACSSAGGSDFAPWASLSQNWGGRSTEASITGYDSPAMVDAMDALRSALTLEERRDAMVDVQEVWNEDAASAIYGHQVTVFAWSDAVEGLEFSSEHTPILDRVSVTG